MATMNRDLIGKYAFTAIVEEAGYCIGRADYGVRGYTPIRVQGYTFDTYEEAKAFAKDQNKRMGLTDQQAMEIVFNTM